MKLRIAILLLCAIGLAAFSIYRSKSTKPAADGDGAAHDQPAAAPTDKAAEADAVPNAAPAVAAADAGTGAAQPAAAPAAQAPKPSNAKLTNGESAMLTMYDAIAAAFEKENHDCDVMAAELDAIVTRSSSDVQRWSDEQKNMDDADRAAAAQRLETTAGPRVQRAQAAMRAAMTTCAQSERFQVALRKLVALNPTQ